MLPPPKTSRLRVLALALVLLDGAGCTRAGAPPASPDELGISKEPPPAGATPVGTIRAVDGEGCGLLGTKGTYEGAEKVARNKARALGADYVRITSVHEPYADHECVHKEYVIEGIAYRSSAAQGSAAQAATLGPPRAVVASTPLPTLPERGLSLAPSGCAFLAPSHEGGRSLYFSGRLKPAGSFGLWIDRELRDGGPAGLKLEYDASSGRLSLAKYPEGVTVTIASEPLMADQAFHEFRLLRAPDRVSTWVDGKLMLLYAAAMPAEDGSFVLEGDALELRRIVLDAGSD